ncbi:transglutaminase-like domain-containing protein [Aureliella helgolandensis]|uniref:Transglutaminase-like superfamily protein n=1 Tax=Aureliella helgolandensis TaxID=2527968 RepID=A0A518G0D0_9BACT|nr:transglutaminase family protein [Aureliella helgolandensis]QDV22053.1 Transglutaminase-like superfamily protein [Aureliella helgolandensis]
MQKSIEVGCNLSYEVRQSTVFLFQISCALTPHQVVDSESLILNPNLATEAFSAGIEANRMHRVVVEPCELNVSYRGNITLTPEIDEPGEVNEASTAHMPPEVLTYLNPSRYCESDLLGRFAFEEFGHLYRGYSRVQAVCNWVCEHLDYTPGSTNSSTTATAVLLQRAGVCRDYAHLAITLCRGLGIPARYVAGYAVNLQPPDFHGFMEAFLGDRWYLFDPTRLSLVSGLVRIGAGRDAADVAIATLNGDARLLDQQVWASDVTDPAAGGGAAPESGISTA